MLQKAKNKYHMSGMWSTSVAFRSTLDPSSAADAPGRHLGQRPVVERTKAVRRY